MNELQKTNTDRSPSDRTYSKKKNRVQKLFSRIKRYEPTLSSVFPQPLNNLLTLTHPAAWRDSGNVAERTLTVAGLSSSSVRSKGMRRSRTSGTCRIDRGEGQQRAKKKLCVSRACTRVNGAPPEPRILRLGNLTYTRLRGANSVAAAAVKGISQCVV